MSDYLLQQVINALSAGSLYALMAVGLALIFGILRLINFAHGDVMMVAAYLAFFSLASGMPLPVAVVTMVVGTILVGLVIERVAYRPLRGAPEVALLLTSFAVGQILQNGVLLLTRLSGRADPARVPCAGRAQRRRQRRDVHDLEGQPGQLRGGRRRARAPHALRLAHEARAVDACRRRGPRRGPSHGHPHRLRGGRGASPSPRRWPPSRASSTPPRPARSTRTWASRRS